MIFTIKTYAAAHRRLVKQRWEAEKKAQVSPMAVDHLLKLINLHDRILDRLDREIEDWGWG